MTRLQWLVVLIPLALLGVALFGLVTTLPTHAHAQCRVVNGRRVCIPQKQSMVKQAVVKQQAVVEPVYPVVNYFVGAPLRQEAVLKYEIRAAVKEALREELRSPLSASQHHSQPSAHDSTSPPSRVLAASTYREQFCFRCHSGDEPKAGMSLDVEHLDDATRVKMARNIISGKMPPDNPLSNEAKSALLIELFEPQPESR